MILDGMEERKLSLSDELDKIYQQIKQNLLYFDGKSIANDNNYPLNFFKWVLELTQKNKYIYNKKAIKDDCETIRRRRQYVYWVDFGKNVGSEINDWHFAVVIHESLQTAVVVPFSSDKGKCSAWIDNNDLAIPLGVLNDLPQDKKPCYAMVNHIQVISKKRLNSFGNKKEGYIDLKLSNEQMKLIDNTIEKYFLYHKKQVD